MKTLIAVLLTITIGIGTHAGDKSKTPVKNPYNKAAGKNVIMQSRSVEEVDKDGQVRKRIVQERVKGDKYGNAAGSQYDLAVDGAFEGKTVAVLHFYTMENFDFSLPKKALKQKGFSVYRWINGPPSAKELEKKLNEACQLWIISSDRRLLKDEHVKVIKKFFESGKGVYIWGDNQPYYADANVLARALFDIEMKGNLMGNKVVGLQKEKGKVGVRRGHLVTTGLEHLYEGITIATIKPNANMVPLLYGSANNLVTVAYEKDGKRAIIDGGFTRLYCNWDTAGTGRYVKNAAAWLVNHERFGKKVAAIEKKK